MGREDVLRAIRTAENEARNTVSKAESDASEIISKARLSATELVQEGRSQSEGRRPGLISAARAPAAAEAKKVSNEGDSSIDSIHKGSDGNRAAAVKTVLDAFRS